MTQVTFVQAADNKKTVVATRDGNPIYLANALLNENKPIYEALGGQRVEGAKACIIEFKTAAKAKKFIAQAITSMSKKEYEATRKVAEGNKKSTSAAGGNKRSAEGNKKPVSTGKGNNAVEVVTLTDENGNKYTVPKSALTQAQAKETKKGGRKGKGNNAVAPTTSEGKSKKSTREDKKPARKSKGNAPTLSAEAQKTLDKMKMSVLNRAASAYSIAHGGEATTFNALGKSEKAIKEFIPKAKAGLLKSSKWEKAVKDFGLTEEMLG